MADETADTNPELTSEPSGISRRELGKRGGMLGAAVGAAWTAPMVFDSFSNPAAAAGTSLVNTTTPGVVTPPVTIPANRTAQFTIIGGGGAGGWYQAFNGGSATKLVGRITPSSSSRTVAVTVGQGGQAAPLQRGASDIQRAATRVAERETLVVAAADRAPSSSARPSSWSPPGVPAPAADQAHRTIKEEQPDHPATARSTRA